VGEADTAEREAIEAALSAFSSGDPEQVVRHIAEDFEGVVPASMSAEPDRYVGHAGVRRYFETFEDAIDDLRFENRLAGRHGEWWLVALRVSGQGRGSGVPIALDAIVACLMRDGKLVRMVAYPSVEEARAGVVEPTPRR
jgi:ketosteroid isomerase-like protein